MKIMIFVDDSNFKANIKCINIERKQDRIIDYHKIHRFVLEYLSQNPQYKDELLSHIRTYIYTGEYTDALFHRIKKFKEGQRKFLSRAMTYNFFEMTYSQNKSS